MLSQIEKKKLCVSWKSSSVVLLHFLGCIPVGIHRHNLLKERDHHQPHYANLFQPEIFHKKLLARRKNRIIFQMNSTTHFCKNFIVFILTYYSVWLVWIYKGLVSKNKVDAWKKMMKKVADEDLFLYEKDVIKLKEFFCSNTVRYRQKNYTEWDALLTLWIILKEI